MPIVRVDNPSTFKNFLLFPWQVYPPASPWVPPLLREVKFLLSRRNPFWEHGEMQCFIYQEGGHTLGRICAILDFNHLVVHRERAGFFGFFECLSNPDAAEALMQAASDWLRSKKMRIIRGPVNPSLNETGGMLVEGFDFSPFFMMPYNPPEYPGFLEDQGFNKAKDLLVYRGDLPEQTPHKLHHVVEIFNGRHPEISIRPLDMRYLARDLKFIRNVYNNAWSDNWGFTPISESEVTALAKRCKAMIIPSLIQIAFHGKNPVGFIMVVPDFNPFIKNCNGRIWPWLFAAFTYEKRHIRALRVMALGVNDMYRGQGIDAALIERVYREARRMRVQTCESSWILEDNRALLKTAALMGGQPSMKYRLYEKKL